MATYFRFISVELEIFKMKSKKSNFNIALQEENGQVGRQIFLDSIDRYEQKGAKRAAYGTSS